MASTPVAPAGGVSQQVQPANVHHTSHVIPIKGDRIQEMIQCIRNLSDRDIDNIVALPRICVVGQQSAGKSLLVEALSSIKKPRDSGTVTLCPMEFNLVSRDDTSTWHCKISLIEKWAHNPTGVVHQSQNHRDHLGDWFRTDTKSHQFADIFSPHVVPQILNEAQSLLLCPDDNWEHFCPRINGVQLPEKDALKKFSPNLVRLDISGPGIFDLSFVDLPGIVTNPQEKGKRKIKESKELANTLMRNNVKDPSAIIVLALPMNEDSETDTAFSIVRELEAEPRTIGVLTKADRVADEDLGPRLDRKLHNLASFGLRHGYHAVRLIQPSSEAHMSPEDSELLFFQDQKWSAFHVNDNFGVRKLAVKMQVLLEAKIADQFDEINTVIVRKKLEKQKRLDKFPTYERPRRRPLILQDLLSDFHLGLLSTFATTVPRRWTGLAEAFHAALTECKPGVHWGGPDSNQIQCPNQTSARKRGSESKELDEFASPRRPTVSGFRGNEFASLNNSPATYSLAALRGLARDQAPLSVSRIASSGLQTIFQRYTSLRPPILTEFHNRLATLVLEEVFNVIVAVFGRYTGLRVYPRIKTIVKDFIEEAIQGQEVSSTKLYSEEYSVIDTLDVVGFERIKDDSFEKLIELGEDYTDEVRRNAGNPRRGSQQPRGRAANGRGTIQAGDDADKIVLQLMTKAWAYCEILGIQFANNIRRSVQIHLLNGFVNNLRNQLRRHLGLDPFTEESAESIEELMTKNEERDRERTELQGQLTSLREARTVLNRVLGPQAIRTANDGTVEMSEATQTNTHGPRRALHAPRPLHYPFLHQQAPQSVLPRTPAPTGQVRRDPPLAITASANAMRMAPEDWRGPGAATPLSSGGASAFGRLHLLSPLRSVPGRYPDSSSGSQVGGHDEETQLGSMVESLVEGEDAGVPDTPCPTGGRPILGAHLDTQPTMEDEWEGP